MGWGHFASEPCAMGHGENSTVNRVRRWILERGLGLLYHQLAWAYDGVSWLVSGGNWRTWQRVALSRVAGPRVLELGFGTGSLLCDLAETASQVWGLELSAQMMRIARRKLHLHGLCPRMVRGRGQALPFASGAFDSLMVTFPSPFIVESGTLREVSRVLRTGGRLVVIPQAYPRRRGLLDLLCSWLFGATGVAVSPPWKEMLEPAGLHTTVEELQLGNSTVQVVTANKGEESLCPSAALVLQ